MTEIYVDIYADDNGLAFRRVEWDGDERVIGGEESGPIDTLDDLERALREAQISEHSECPLDDLPTFGGPEPDDTTEIYSWDAARLLVHDGQGGFRLEYRDAV